MIIEATLILVIDYKRISVQINKPDTYMFKYEIDKGNP